MNSLSLIVLLVSVALSKVENNNDEKGILQLGLLEANKQGVLCLDLLGADCDVHHTIHKYNHRDGHKSIERKTEESEGDEDNRQNRAASSEETGMNTQQLNGFGSGALTREEAIKNYRLGKNNKGYNKGGQRYPKSNSQSPVQRDQAATPQISQAPNQGDRAAEQPQTQGLGQNQAPDQIQQAQAQILNSINNNNNNINSNDNSNNGNINNGNSNVGNNNQQYPFTNSQAPQAQQGQNEQQRQVEQQRYY